MMVPVYSSLSRWEVIHCATKLILNDMMNNGILFSGRLHIPLLITAPNCPGLCWCEVMGTATRNRKDKIKQSI